MPGAPPGRAVVPPLREPSSIPRASRRPGFDNLVAPAMWTRWPPAVSPGSHPGLSALGPARPEVLPPGAIDPEWHFPGKPRWNSPFCPGPPRPTQSPGLGSSRPPRPVLPRSRCWLLGSSGGALGLPTGHQAGSRFPSSLVLVPLNHCASASVLCGKGISWWRGWSPCQAPHCPMEPAVVGWGLASGVAPGEQMVLVYALMSRQQLPSLRPSERTLGLSQTATSGPRALAGGAKQTRLPPPCGPPPRAPQSPSTWTSSAWFWPACHQLPTP